MELFLYEMDYIKMENLNLFCNLLRTFLRADHKLLLNRKFTTHLLMKKEI